MAFRAERKRRRARSTLGAGLVQGSVRTLLRLEGLALLAAATLAYAQTGLSWWLYLALFFAPDLSFAAYAAGPRAGALAYNAAHTTVGALLLATGAWLAGAPIPTAVGLIWAAHIGFDRALGYGLKYATGFGDTHLGRVGRA